MLTPPQRQILQSTGTVRPIPGPSLKGRVRETTSCSNLLYYIRQAVFDFPILETQYGLGTRRARREQGEHRQVRPGTKHAEGN